MHVCSVGQGKKGVWRKGYTVRIWYLLLFINLYPCEVIHTFVEGLSITFWDFEDRKHFGFMLQYICVLILYSVVCQ